MNYKFYFLVCYCLTCNLLKGQETASDLLDKSIAFHDPSHHWKQFESELAFKVVRPDRPDAKRTVIINNKNQFFSFSAPYEEGTLTYEVKENVGKALWDKKEDIPKEMAENYKISTERAMMYKNYYTYLYGMPMKLKDEGTIIDPKIEQVDFYGKTYHRIRVTYDPNVGNDIWYFYFSTKTNALEAYQFYHDEDKNDGEYILFEELKEIQGVKFPKIRKWYYNSDQKFLATDILE